MPTTAAPVLITGTLVPPIAAPGAPIMFPIYSMKISNIRGNKDEEINSGFRDMINVTGKEKAMTYVDRYWT